MLRIRAPSVHSEHFIRVAFLVEMSVRFKDEAVILHDSVHIKIVFVLCKFLILLLLLKSIQPILYLSCFG